MPEKPTPSTTVDARPAGLSAPVGSAPSFIRDAITKRLAELRETCAIKQEGVRHAQDPKTYWGSDSGQSTYWRDLKAKCAAERPAELAAAKRELADFITEHRPIMGADWVPDGHGCQCWAPYLGGAPIGQYYCDREPGHTGPHRCHRGAWPQGVDGDQAWHRLLATLPKGATGLEDPAPQNTEVRGG